MAITLNGGTGVITGVSVGGLPDGCVANDDLAGSIVDGKITGLTASKLTGALPAISGASLTGVGTSIFAGHTTRDLTAGAGTQAITGVGFQPKAVYFSGGQTGTQQISWGWSVDLSTDFSFCIADDHDTTADTLQVFYTGGVDQSISFRTALGVNQSAKVTTWGADGFTLTWTKAGSPSGTMQISYLCIG